MSILLLVLTLVAAIVDWAAVDKSWKKVEYILKPAVMVLLLGWLWQFGGFQKNLIWFALGLLFSLGGDIVLMLPQGWFLAGLVLFLMTHLSYIIGFRTIDTSQQVAGWLLGIISLLFTLALILRFAVGLKKKNLKKLYAPVMIYIMAINAMVLSALLTFFQPGWKINESILVSCGAILFLISDWLLAWDRFIQPVPRARTLVMITYHVGQIGIILGAAQHFLQA